MGGQLFLACLLALQDQTQPLPNGQHQSFGRLHPFQRDEIEAIRKNGLEGKGLPHGRGQTRFAHAPLPRNGQQAAGWLGQLGGNLRRFRLAADERLEQGGEVMQPFGRGRKRGRFSF